MKTEHTLIADPDLRILLRHQHQLVDDPAGLLVTGCRPGDTVTMTAYAEVDGARFEATATFEADADGEVDTAHNASLAGTYTGIDPFGLWWSGNPVDRDAGVALSPIACRVQVETGGRSADLDFDRHWLAAGVTPTVVREDGVWGLYVRPAGPGPFPGVVAFGGSGGGLGPAAAWAPVLASHGVATLAIAYFGVENLPTTLVRIEVEVVERAIAWLKRQPDVAAGPVALMGMSRGSELALLAGGLLEDVGAVVAFAPSGIAWSGLDSGGPVTAPAWTFRGADLPFMATGDISRRPQTGTEQALDLVGLFELSLEDDAAAQAAEIPIERINGPILFVSGLADTMWPSTRMTEVAERRAADHGFAHHLLHLRYPNAGHIGAGVPGTPVLTEAHNPLTGLFLTFGGTRAGSASARADSWPRVVAFLQDALATG